MLYTSIIGSLFHHSQVHEEQSMSVTIKVGELLRQFAGNQARVEVNGLTIRECVDDLVKKYPAIKGSLFDKNGILMVLITHNYEMITQKSLDKKIPDGAEIGMTMILGGG
jgi:molybdopterin converting factor small subunit